MQNLYQDDGQSIGRAGLPEVREANQQQEVQATSHSPRPDPQAWTDAD